jgi:hypothetical protein
VKNFLVASLILVACGDNGNNPPADAHVAIDSPAIDAAPAVPKVVAVAGDFTTPPGVMSVLNTSTLAVQQNVAAAVVTDDPQLRHIGHELYVIDRDTNNITVLDDTTYTLIGQMATGAGTNPQDVAIVGDKLYVPALASKGVVIGTLGGSTSVLDLTGAAAVNSIDTTPDCVGAYAVGTDVYVVCENLDESNGFTPRGPGVLIVIDSTTDTMRTKVMLPMQNPQGFIKQMGANLIVASNDGAAGCTTTIAPGATPTATCLTQNTDLGGPPIAFDISGTKIWFAYAASDFSHQWARAYDTTTSSYAPNLTPDSQDIFDIAVCPNHKVAVTDGTTNANGFRLYNGTTEATTSALAIGLKPAFANGLVCY